MENKQYLLDTNILIEFVHGNRSVINRILHAGFDRCCMSVVSLQELYYGAYKAKYSKQIYFDQEMVRINMLRNRFMVLPLPEEADGYGQIKANLQQKGELIDEFDMLIGGHALAEGLTVVTDNVRHFERIPGLKFENWRVDSD